MGAEGRTNFSIQVIRTFTCIHLLKAIVYLFILSELQFKSIFKHKLR